MAFRRILYVNGIDGVIPGGVATANLPLERRYHLLKLYVTGKSAADEVLTDPASLVERVRLIVNGVTIRDVVAQDILDIADRMGLPAAVNELPIYFSEPNRASVLGEELSSWDMFGQAKFTLEVVLKSDIKTPSVQILASYDFSRNTDGKTAIYNILHQKSLSYSHGAGKSDITAIPQTYPIHRLHLIPTVANVISTVEISNAGEKIWEATAAQNERILADYGLKSKRGYSVMFDHEQQLTSNLIPSDLVVSPTIDGAGSVRVLIESRRPGYV